MLIYIGFNQDEIVVLVPVNEMQISDLFWFIPCGNKSVNDYAERKRKHLIFQFGHQIESSEYHYILTEPQSWIFKFAIGKYTYTMV